MPIDEVQPDEAGAQPVLLQEPKARRALARLKRELTDDELSSTGVQKMLLDSLERAEEEVAELRRFRDQYYEADKRNGVLQEKFQTKIAMEVISTGTIAIGAAAFVYAPEAWKSQPDGWIALAFGIAATVAGIIAKVIHP
jgi:hypothetical protein